MLCSRAVAAWWALTRYLHYTARWTPRSPELKAHHPVHFSIDRPPLHTCARSLELAPRDGRPRRRPHPAPGPRSCGPRAVQSLRCCHRRSQVPRPAGSERRPGTCRCPSRSCLRREEEGTHGASVQCPHHRFHQRWAVPPLTHSLSPSLSLSDPVIL
jgi:hypothetical protein